MNTETNNIYDFSDIEKVLDGEKLSINFEETVASLATGESQGIFMDVFKDIFNQIFVELIYNQEVMVKIILLTICLAFLNNLSLVFKNGQISETGFFVIYCMIITIMLSGFIVLSQMIAELVGILIQFMNALIPAMMLALGFTGAYTSQSGFCQIIVLAMVLVEKILLTLIIPMINVYVVLMLVNSLVNEDYISKLAGLIESFVKWFIKSMLALFLGMNIIQGMISPSIDAAKLKGIEKLTSAIGGNVVGNVVVGTSNIIKNAIGASAVIVIVIIVAIPIVKVLASVAMYRFTAAIIQPVSDKRVMTAVESVAKGASLLYKLAVFCGVLFGLSIAIMCVATNNVG